MAIVFRRLVIKGYFKKEEIVKEKMVFGLAVLFLAALAGMPGAYAEADFAEAYEQPEWDYSDPSAFEGDSENMPGERAPENMPMDDAPVDAGIGAML